MIRWVLVVVVLGLVVTLISSPLVGKLVSEETEQMRFISAYPLTQRFITVINLLSASPEYESAEIKINPLNCTINFYDNGYVETTVKTKKEKTSYGLFTFPVNLDAPSQITCDPENEKTITIVKIGDVIKIIEGTYDWGEKNPLEIICENKDGIFLAERCWFLGSFAEDCDQLCSAKGMTCKEPDWTKIPEDCTLHEKFGFTSDCVEAPDQWNKYAPGHLSSTSEYNLYHNSTAISKFNCYVSSNQFERICPCVIE